MTIVIVIIALAQVGVALFRFVKFGGKLRQTTSMAGLVVPSWVWILTFLAFQAVLFVIMALAARKLPSAGQSDLRATVSAVDALENKAIALARQWETGFQTRRGEAQQVLARLEGVYGAYWGANSSARTDPISPVIVPPAVTLPRALASDDPPDFSTDLEAAPETSIAQESEQPAADTPSPNAPPAPSAPATGAGTQQAVGQDGLAPEVT